ncbi:MAG: sel1 repeat family protein [Endomicrobium sp.]|jgi:TPR repeat protein|nr:sel1 repeat family protein [Endomicrobium sp.]
MKELLIVIMKKLLKVTAGIVFVVLLFRVIIPMLMTGFVPYFGQIKKSSADKEHYEMIKNAAEQGNANAKIALDNMWHNYAPAKIELFKQTKKSAEEGSAEGQLKLAEMYYNGKSVERDYAEAVKWYQKAAEQGNADAEYSLGSMYYNGYGVEKNGEKAIYWYQKAAEHGWWGDAYSAIATMYYFGNLVEKDRKKAIYWYQKSEEKGFIGGTNRLGEMYYYGPASKKSVRENVERAIKDAKRGKIRAIYALGNMYYDGYGVKKDYAEAEKWYRKATFRQVIFADAESLLDEVRFEQAKKSAEEGNAESQFKLAEMYYRGKGVKKNIEEAEIWRKKAAEQGYVSYAIHENPLSAVDIPRTGLRRHRRRIHEDPFYVGDIPVYVEQIKKSEEAVDAESQFKLARMYYRGEEVDQNTAEAFKLFKKAAEQGNAAAQYRLAEMYYYGEGVKQDRAEAVKWVRKAISRKKEAGQ